MGENSEFPPGTLLRFPVLPVVGTCSTSCRERGNAFDKTACLLRCSSPFSVSPPVLILIRCRGCRLPRKVEILKATTPRIGSHVDGAFSQAGRDDATSAQVLHGSGPVDLVPPAAVFGDNAATCRGFICRWRSARRAEYAVVRIFRGRFLGLGLCGEGGKQY